MGEFIGAAVRTLIGIGTFVLPVLLGAVSVLIMLDVMPCRECLIPTITGVSLIVVGLFAIVHADSGRPTNW